MKLYMEHMEIGTIWNIKRSVERVMEKPGNEMDLEERNFGGRGVDVDLGSGG